MSAVKTAEFLECTCSNNNKVQESLNVYVSLNSYDVGLCDMFVNSFISFSLTLGDHKLCPVELNAVVVH